MTPDLQQALDTLRSSATYGGEVRLYRWGDSSAAGMTATFQLDDGPDGVKVNPFKGFQYGTKTGQRFALVAVPIGDDEQPEKPPSKPMPAPPEKKPKRAFHELPRSQQAAIKCQDEHFQAWFKHRFDQQMIRTKLGERPDEITDATLKKLLLIASKSELDGVDTVARNKWDALLAEYEADTNRTAEVRG